MPPFFVARIVHASRCASCSKRMEGIMAAAVQTSCKNKFIWIYRTFPRPSETALVILRHSVFLSRRRQPSLFWLLCHMQTSHPNNYAFRTPAPITQCKTPWGDTHVLPPKTLTMLRGVTSVMLRDQLFTLSTNSPAPLLQPHEADSLKIFILAGGLWFVVIFTESNSYQKPTI